jgi:pimeloyl-ACP methyl ester carboxylesterase
MERRVRGIPIYYEEIGTGKPLLMLHGSHPDHREMLHTMEPLFEQRSGWRRIYPDLPGRGRTPGADWISNQDDMLDIVLEFLDSIASGERFAVAGNSYGGFMARGVVYTRGAQMDGVMLGVPSVQPRGVKPHLPPRQVLVQDEEFAASLAPDEQRILQFAAVQTPEVLASFRTRIKPGAAIADHEFISRTHSNFEFSFDVNKLPEPFPAPTLILTGRQDSICGYREAWSLLDDFPRGTFAVLDRAGHPLSAEQPQLFRALASEWLDRVEEYSAGV